MAKSAIKSAILFTSALTLSNVAMAQEMVAQQAGSGASEGFGDIIVTARRRDETSISVPVVLTAVTGQTLEHRGISSMDSLAQLVPGLTIQGGGGTIQGGTIALRGVAGPDSNALGDQAVSFNIDGVQVAKAGVRRLAFMDIEQVEVLRGPQALFFGKNSPGGIISIRTADPTPNLAAKLSIAHEFKADEWRGEGFISGPLTDTLGARLAFYGSDMRGWVKNIVPKDSLRPPFNNYLGKWKEFALRGTLKYDPTDAFSARLKLSYNKGKGDPPVASAQVFNCPTGISQFPGPIVSDCKADNKNNYSDNIGTVFTQFEPRFRNGHVRSSQEQILAGLEMNYAVSDSIDLTSVTGFYKNRGDAVDHYVPYPVIPILQFGFSFGLPEVVVYYKLKNRDISQELRLNTDFDGPLNFTVGGIYTDTRATVTIVSFLNATTPFAADDLITTQKGTAYSAFGQARFDVTSELELAAGGRYSYEKKTLPVTLSDFTNSGTNPPLPYQPLVDRVSFNDFSPELTITYRPTDQLTLFAAYKKGFLSGGFNGQLALTDVAMNYGPQKIRGFEGGVKASLFGGALRANLSAFSYSVPGLQVTSYVPREGGLAAFSLRNAGGAKTKGIEFDMNYRTPIEGLSLRAGLSYNDAYYTDYFGTCYRGQSQGEGCNYISTGVGAARPIQPGEQGNTQNLAGGQLINAPKWAGNVGASYDVPLNSALKLGLSADVDFSSKKPTDASLTPGTYSPSYAIVGATARISDIDDAWEVALIGRNLTNEFYWSNPREQAFTGGASGLVTSQARADYYGVINRGREVMVRLTVAFGK